MNSLSDKIINATQFMGRSDVKTAIPIEDVKEFIKSLKDWIDITNQLENKYYIHKAPLRRRINKLAGGKLI